MGDALRLRPMTEDEYAVWRERSEREYAVEIAESRDLETATAVEQSAAEFAQLLPEGLASPGMHLWTAVVADEPVGIGWLELRRRASGVTGWIFDIRVDSDRRGQGLGRGLLEALHRAARDLGATSISLNVFGHNTTAIHLYDALGYTVTAQQMKRDLT